MPLTFAGRLSTALASALQLLPELAVAAVPVEPIASFQTEKEAQEHCPGGLVVWLDLATKIYYYRGQQTYGSTKKGAYVCRDEAKSAGMRASRSSQ